MLFIVMDGAGKTFTMIGFIILLMGVIAELLVLFSDFKFAVLIPTLLYTAGFALALNSSLPSLSDVWNGVTYIGGNATLGMTFTSVFFICSVAGIVACFMPQRTQKIN